MISLHTKDFNTYLPNEKYLFNRKIVIIERKPYSPYHPTNFVNIMDFIIGLTLVKQEYIRERYQGYNYKMINEIADSDFVQQFVPGIKIFWLAKSLKI